MALLLFFLLAGLVVAALVEDVGVVVCASMPGALGESARLLPTFLVPETEELVVEELEAGVVCCAEAMVEQPSKAASRRNVFMWD